MQKNSWENDSFSSIQFSLIIKGKNFDFDNMRKNLSFEPITIIKEGDMISRVTGKNKNDMFMYEKTCNCEEDFIKDLDCFLNTLLAKKNYIIEYIEKYNTVLRLYMQSSQAEMFFSLSHDIIKKVYELKIPIEFSILSWGNV